MCLCKRDVEREIKEEKDIEVKRKERDCCSVSNAERDKEIKKEKE